MDTVKTEVFTCNSGMRGNRRGVLWPLHTVCGQAEAELNALLQPDWYEISLD